MANGVKKRVSFQVVGASVLDHSIVYRFSRSKCHLPAVIGPFFLHTCGIDAEQGFIERPVAIDQAFVLGIVKEPSRHRRTISLDDIPISFSLNPNYY